VRLGRTPALREAKRLAANLEPMYQ
jgi:hypothetical protein